MKLGHRHSLSKSANNATATDWPPSAPPARKPILEAVTATATRQIPHGSFNFVVAVGCNTANKNWKQMRQQRLGKRQTGYGTRDETWDRRMGRQTDADADTGTCWCRCRSPKLTELYVGLSVRPSRRMRCRGWQLALKTPSVECRPRSRCRSRLGLASRVVGNAWQARTRPARVSAPFLPLSLSLFPAEFKFDGGCAARAAHVLPPVPVSPRHFPHFPGRMWADSGVCLCRVSCACRLVLSTSPRFPLSTFASPPPPLPPSTKV